uniref:Uncharacterized protein n=1 Tax=Meloidogyne enterolobii TaxID=390850 RepID=A0A6V7Y346_MELEN|nr:unnamed protein product [Meloidogyne enterolobii]
MSEFGLLILFLYFIQYSIKIIFPANFKLNSPTTFKLNLNKKSKHPKLASALVIKNHPISFFEIDLSFIYSFLN